MFKIFIMAFLASGGHPIGSATSKDAYPTIEQCELVAGGDSAKSVSGYQKIIEERLGQKVRLAATCAEATSEGVPVDKDKLIDQLGKEEQGS